MRFAALGQGTRLSLCRRVAGAGARGMTPGALADAEGIAHNLVSHHLRPLVAAGLLSSEKSGREVVYRAVPFALVETAGVLLGLGADAAR